MKTYRIADWDRVYETAETRKLENLRWVPIPNKLDGLGFRRLVANRERSDLLAAWVLIVEVASRGRRKERGTLARDGQPLTADDLALMTGFPAPVFERALSFFSDPKQGWLLAEVPAGETAPEASDPAQAGGSPSCPPTPPARPADSPASPAASPAEGNGRNGMERREAAGAPEAAPNGGLPEDAQWLAALANDPTYAGIDVPREHGKMRTWCLHNHKQPTRRRFVNWLNRAERPIALAATSPTASYVSAAPSNLR